jgi:aldehyde dehydrogenase (NAD+)
MEPFSASSLQSPGNGASLTTEHTRSESSAATESSRTTDTGDHSDTGAGASSVNAPTAPIAPTVAAVVAGLRATFATGRTREIGWRLDQLAAIERLVGEREADIARALFADLGRSAVDAWLGDVASARTEAAYAHKHLRSWMRSTRTGLPLALRPGRAFYRYEPLGTVLVIGPWNYPVYLCLGPLIGALAAGNCCIVKPSEHAPATSALLASLLPRYLDNDAVAVIEGDATTSQALISEGLDHVFFTGGAAVGALVLAAAAPHLTPVTLELGGKSPTVVTRSANIEVAARRIAWTKFLNSGQTCVAPDYILVESAIRDELVDKIGQSARQLAGGSMPSLPIVNRRQYERLTALLDAERDNIVFGGVADPDRVAIQPTIIVDPDPAADLMSEEIFGPILPVLTVDSLSQAIDYVSARPKPLAAYLFSSDRAQRRRFVNEVSAGAISVNQAAVHVLIPQLPFGGVGTSGMGSYHGRWGFETFSHRKSVFIKPARPDPSLTYPPYTKRSEGILRRIF